MPTLPFPQPPSFLPLSTPPRLYSLLPTPSLYLSLSLRYLSFSLSNSPTWPGLSYLSHTKQDDLRTLLLDSTVPFIRELAEIDLVPGEPQQHQGTPPHGSPTTAGSLPGAASPLSPPPPPTSRRGSGGVGGGSSSPGMGRSPSFSPQRRSSRRGSDRGGGLANATTVSSLFRRFVYTSISVGYLHVVKSTPNPSASTKRRDSSSSSSSEGNLVHGLRYSILLLTG